jgi:hypothetical protein
MHFLRGLMEVLRRQWLMVLSLTGVAGFLLWTVLQGEYSLLAGGIGGVALGFIGLLVVFLARNPELLGPYYNVLFLLCIIGFVVCVEAVGAERMPEPEFYSISAQVIPIVILALVIEARIVESMAEADLGTLGIVALPIFILSAGEYEALEGVWGRGKEANEGVIVASLFVGFGLLLFGAVVGNAARALSERWKPDANGPEKP